ncbi:hypothetical protein CIG19_00640 [Enterobacterales bacterium CwR94]|nr:hypothetical protein CIG19_00640 [Enterobacterales bacterium CwR94]
MNQLIERFFNYTFYQTPTRRGRRLSHNRAREQLLAQQLQRDLQALGLREVTFDSYGAVSAWLPGNEGVSAPVLGFIAPLSADDHAADTAVHPQLVECYRGGDIALGQGDAVISPVRVPELHALIGQTLITGDGTRAMGCEATAGITVIMSLLEQLQTQPHGDVHVAFVPAGERGRDALVALSQKALRVDYAWCLSGGVPGELAWENRHQSTVEIKIAGSAQHSALAAAFALHQTWLQHGGVATDVLKMRGDGLHTELTFQLCEREQVVLDQRLSALAQCCQQQHQHGLQFQFESRYTARNMAAVNTAHNAVIELARQAIDEQQLTLTTPLARDDSLSIALVTAGTPCAQLFSGGYLQRTPQEFVTLEGLQHSVQVVMGICRQALGLSQESAA